jgi:thioredoxin reductase
VSDTLYHPYKRKREMRQQIESELGSVDLVVIGGGPVGIAALWFAALQGLKALAIEAGPAPLHHIRSYMDGLVMISPAEHYEIPGIPLDCRDAGQLTREDILYYYGRIINLGRLDIRCDCRCISLTSRQDHVEVGVEWHDCFGHFKAKDVLVSAWYRPRQLFAPMEAERAGVRVLPGLKDVLQTSGQRCVVVGGGFSAYEHACALMRAGQAIKVVMRGGLSRSFTSDEVQSLVAATGSELIERVTGVELRRGGLYLTQAGNAARLLACDVIIACVGQIFNAEIGHILRDAGVLTADEMQQLETAVTLDTLVRQKPTVEGCTLIQEAIRMRPDLWLHLFKGRRHIRLIGGALHVGGSQAGVAISIRTARLAVDSIYGHRPSRDFWRPLAACLAAPSGLDAPPPVDITAHLHPLAVRSWSRGAGQRAVGEDLWGFKTHLDNPLSQYILGPLRLNESAQQILQLSNGEFSVKELAQRTGLDYELFATWCAALWKSNALSWLPPRRGLSEILP